MNTDTAAAPEPDPKDDPRAFAEAQRDHAVNTLFRFRARMNNLVDRISNPITEQTYSSGFAALKEMRDRLLSHDFCKVCPCAECGTGHAEALDAVLENLAEVIAQSRRNLQAAIARVKDQNANPHLPEP